ncbi:hypothetical protein B4U79_03724 [Dinothrombium tinctorium]|uniref:DUF4758 domain-containing protein n=1 Tax=Dinothrombium tinctorium TaxID=1965070 RepID=A0A443RC45_9ACAR|nr:hypothetical protein B4U79_03724 [Dinothrombium tinctorium]
MLTKSYCGTETQTRNVNTLLAIVIFADINNNKKFRLGLLIAVTNSEKLQQKSNLPTVTVRGFLNFRTTVDGTIIIFTPASAAIESTKHVLKSTSAEPLVITSRSRAQEIKPTSTQAFVVSTSSETSEALSSKKVNAEQYPIGLVTLLKGAVVHNGATTVYETRVIGTYIDGKYAQILKSTSSINLPTLSSSLSKIEPTSTVKSVVLPTAMPKPVRPVTKATPIKSPVLKLRQNAEIAAQNKKSAAFENKENSIQPSFRNREFALLQAEATTQTSNRLIKHRFGRVTEKPITTTTSRIKIRVPGRSTNRRKIWTPRQSPRVAVNRFKVKIPSSREKEEEEAAKEINKRFQNRFGVQKQKEEPKVKKEETKEDSSADNVYKPPILSLENSSSPGLDSAQIEPHKVVKEVQTITSEITQHIDGNNIKVDTTTWTTTVQRTIHPSEFDGSSVIAPTILPENNDVDATSIAETPPIVISRTYSVTERSMRTTVVPVFDGTLTTNHTVTESFFIRKLITAYKTMPPGDLQLLETASLEMNNNSYVDNIQGAEQAVLPSVFEGKIEFRDSEDDNSIHPTLANFNTQPTIEPSLNVNQFTPLPQIDLNNPLIIGAALRNPNLAALYFSLQQLKQQPLQYETITKPTEFLTTETVFNTKVVSFYDGRQTRTRTINEPGSTVSKVVKTYVTEVTPVINPQLYLQQAQLQQMFATQLLNPNLNPAPLNPLNVALPQSTRTITTVTTMTSTSTKVYTLVYNAFSTRYRTVTSTSIFPTTVTTYSTVAMANTLGPPAFNPFFG